MEDLVIAVDVSLSMKASDYIPSRMEAAKRAVLSLITAKLEKNVEDRIGVVAFYGRSLPIIDLTRNKELLISVIRQLRVLGEATAPGDGLKEALYMLRGRWPKIGKERVLIVTDGTFNEGIPLDVVAEYAARRNVIVDFLTLGKLTGYDKTMISRTLKLTGGVHEHARTTSELINKAIKLAIREIP